MSATTQNLEGRIARCHCGNTRPSTDNLAFFEFQGEGSREAMEICRCGYAWIAHQPRWSVTIKRKGDVHQFNREYHAPPGKEIEMGKSEATAFHGEALGISEAKSHIKCASFTPKGPQQFDKFYCGCDGWD